MDRTSRTKLEGLTLDRQAMASNIATIRVAVGCCISILAQYEAIGGSYAADMDSALDALCLAGNGADTALAREQEKEVAIRGALN